MFHLHISYPALLFFLTYFETSGGSCICQRRKGDPLRVYMDLEAGRRRSGYEDVFISYHAKDDVQSTYAGALFHNNRNYRVSSYKNNVSIEFSTHFMCYTSFLTAKFSEVAFVLFCFVLNFYFF